MNQYDSIQVRASVLAHYRSNPRQLVQLKIGQRGVIILVNNDGTADVQLEDFPALLVIGLKSLAKLEPSPAPHTRE